MEVFRNTDFVESWGWASDLPRRDCFSCLEEYLDGDFPRRACVLYGLRRTGKSVLMHQAMLERLDSSAYVVCTPRDCVDDISTEMRRLWREGVRNFFLDEVSSLPDFIDCAQVLVDPYVGNGRVVMTGTDSLSFEIAGHTSLSGRTAVLHTTWIPFREHSRLLGTCSLDEYARRGGILTDADIFAEYPLEAIALNIQNSLAHYECGRRFSLLAEPYRRNELTTLIQNVVKDENHGFSMDVLKRMWSMSDLTFPRSGLHDVADDVVDYAYSIDAKRLLPDVMARLGVIGAENLAHLRNDGVRDMINGYLQYLELIEPGLVLEYADIRSPGENREGVARKISWRERRRSWRGKWIFRQPGLRWAQIDALLKSVREMMVTDGKFDQDKLGILFAAIRSNAMGGIMEDIIISETARSFDYEVPVFKYLPLVGDVDMVVLRENSIQLYEIKHSSIPRTGKGGHARHIMDDDKTRALEEWFGRKIDFRGVLYSGRTGERYGFVNASEYLMNLDAPGFPMLREAEIALDEGMRL